MAKLTATFEMKDNISSKLKGLYISLEKVESMTDASSKAIDRLDKSKARPTLSVIDTASGKVRTIQGDIDRLHKTKAKSIIDADDQASAVANNIQKKMDHLNGSKATATVTADDQATSVIENVQAKLDTLRGTVLTLGAAGGITGASVFGSGSSTMEQNARTSAVTGMSAGGVNKYVNDIYYNQKTGNSREEVALSLQNMAQQTDLSGNALKNAVKSSNQIAQLYQKDVPEVDRALGSMIKNFNIDSSRAGDNMAYVFKNAGDQYDDLLDTFNEYSSTFADMKLAPEQVSAAFVAGTKKGARNFDDMADSMREFNIRRNEMTDDQVASFKKVLGADEAKKMFDGFADGSYTGQEALYRLADGLAKIESESDRAVIATTLIGTKYEDLKQPILNMAGAIDGPVKATGELNKQFDMMRDNNPMTPINDAGRKVKAIMSEIGSEIISNVAPSFEKLDKWMSSKEGQKALEDMKDTVVGLATFLGGTLAPAAQFTVENFNWVGPLTLVGGALTVFGGTALATVGIINKFKDAAGFFGGGKGGKNGKLNTKGLDDATESMSRMEKKASAGKKSVGGLSQKLKDLFKIKAPKESPLFGSGTGKARGIGGKLGGLAKGAGRLLLPAGILMGAYDVFTSSPGQERTQAIGGAVGGIGGGWGGAAAGASLGTMVAPGVGTLIGGLAGGAAGYFGGDKLGSWIGGLFGGGDKKAAASGSQSAGVTAGVEKELKTLSEKGSTYGKAFATKFSAGLSSTTVSITSWLSSKVYGPMNNAGKTATHYGYAFSYGFVQGLDTAPVDMYTWLSNKVYTPMNSAAETSNHYGYAFAYGFLQGLGTVEINMYSWLSDKVYIPMNSAAKMSNHYGYAFAFGFMNGLTTSPLSVTGWLSQEVYQPLNSTAVGVKAYGSALVYNFKEGIKAIPVGMSVWLKNHVETPSREFVPKAMDWGSGMIGYFVTGMNRQGSNVSETAKNLAKRVEEAFRSELGIHSPSRVMADLGYWSAMGVVKGFSGVDVSNIAKSKADELMMAFGGNYSGGGAAMAQQAIMQALMMTGKPMSLLNPLMAIAKHESGFNPRAINDWDINAQRGDPSVGLFQIINSTFQRWKFPGANDRTNPLHSALAAIRYMDGRYGGILNHPGLKSMAGGGGYLPYAKGGLITHDHIARVGEEGKKEVIIPLERYRDRALGLLQYAQNALGVSQEPAIAVAGTSSPVTLPDAEVKTVQSAMSRGVQTVKSGVRDVIVQIMGESHYHNDMDAEKVGVIAVKAVDDHLKKEYFEMGGVVVDG